jgi:Secretion system C-terminal sorting domain
LGLPGSPLLDGGNFEAYDDRAIGFGDPKSTSVELISQAQNKLEIYPNPTNDFLNLDCDLTQGGPIFCSIRNSLGEVAHSFSVNNQGVGLFSRQISVADWPPGAYFVQWMAGQEVQNICFLRVR